MVAGRGTDDAGRELRSNVVAAVPALRKKVQLAPLSGPPAAADVVTAAALACDIPDASEARAVAFAGVQEALEKSAALLDILADPTHPLMLKADRDVAEAKRQMGHLLADSNHLLLQG